MVNTAPVNDVIIDNLPTENFFAVNVLSHGSVVDTIAQNDGLITLPAALFDNAFDNRISLVLLRDSAAYLGKISFLPSSVSVPFVLKGYLDPTGNFVERPNGMSRCTDFVSVEDVTDIVATGTTGAGARCLVAYDENKTFKSVILGSGDFDHVHIITDGSYAYVRCCSGTDHSLELYYRRRH